MPETPGEPVDFLALAAFRRGVTRWETDCFQQPNYERNLTST